MVPELLNATLFIVAAVMLLGSPRPGIAALVGVGRACGFAGGLRYFWGLQAGLTLAAGFSAAGLFSFIQAVPGLTDLMLLMAVLYLVWLAYQIGTAPVGDAAVTEGQDRHVDLLGSEPSAGRGRRSLRP